ncbi:MAG: PRC-barrel domain-containing protein [Phycisphaerales bacterium]|nr:PRC-barrel domain-containing protein [Phycisphaerales bacterium]
MSHRASVPVLTALMLALAAGAAAPASGQRQTAEKPTKQSVTAAPTVDFRSSDWLRDQKVVNDNGEEIANVSDLVLDRGSGRIEYVIIKTGTILGLGGRAVAIPYGAFRWDAGKDRFVLASTVEQLKQFPEYSADSWTALRESNRNDKSTLRQRLTADAASPSDPYSGNLDTAKQARIEGEITEVERTRTSTFGEQVVITVQSADGSAHKIALGPSWFVNSASAAPMRGDKVVVETLALPRDPDRLLVATHLRTGDRELGLRNTDGSAAWTLDSVESNGNVYSTPYSRYLVLSNLSGMKIDARGSECGKVNDIILDRNSGEIGFLSIDPNQNFLGIADTKRLVPWAVATVTLEGTVRIDASKEMILASPETPSDLSTLNTGTAARTAYEAYKVPAPQYESRKPVSSGFLTENRDWSAEGSIIRAIQQDTLKTMSGKVSDITEIKFEKGIQSARALKIRMSGDAAKDEIVLIGPAWYMENQSPVCKVGDSIEVDACRTTIDGKPYWIARSINAEGRSTMLLDVNNAPAWDRP